jgi:hypothetical protein
MKLCDLTYKIIRTKRKVNHMSTLETKYTDNSSEVNDWRGIYKVATFASLLMLLFIPVQVIIFVIAPPPSTVEGFFSLFQENWFLGLLSLDLIYIVNNALMAIIYLAFYASLREVNKSYMIIALVLGFIGLAAYFPSNPAFEMLSLSAQYSSAATEVQKNILLASGHTMLSLYTGTAFNVYYVLNAITLLILSLVMYKSNNFKKSTATIGLIAGIFMIIPSTAGTIGLIFSILSLIPWVIFLSIVTRRFYQFGNVKSKS